MPPPFMRWVLGLSRRVGRHAGGIDVRRGSQATVRRPAMRQVEVPRTWRARMHLQRGEVLPPVHRVAAGWLIDVTDAGAETAFRRPNGGLGHIELDDARTSLERDAVVIGRQRRELAGAVLPVQRRVDVKRRRRRRGPGCWPCRGGGTAASPVRIAVTRSPCPSRTWIPRSRLRRAWPAQRPPFYAVVVRIRPVSWYIAMTSRAGPSARTLP